MNLGAFDPRIGKSFKVCNNRKLQRARHGLPSVQTKEIPSTPVLDLISTTPPQYLSRI